MSFLIDKASMKIKSKNWKIEYVEPNKFYLDSNVINSVSEEEIDQYFVVYDFENLKELCVLIMLMEKQLNEKNSIISKYNNQIQGKNE